MADLTSWNAVKEYWTKRLAGCIPVYEMSASLGAHPQKLLAVHPGPGGSSGELLCGKYIASGNDGSVYHALYTAPQSWYVCLLGA
jgi:hypothetical protein